jgi:hypothetical protein
MLVMRPVRTDLPSIWNSLAIASEKPFGQHDARSGLLAVDDQADLVAGQQRHDGAARGYLNSVHHLDRSLSPVAWPNTSLSLQIVAIDAKHGKLTASAGTGHPADFNPGVSFLTPLDRVNA